MKMEDIRQLAALMNENGLAEASWREGDSEVRLKKPENRFPAAVPAARAVSGNAAAPAADETAGLHKITSVMVGIFHAAPSPSAAAFVKPGDTVTAGQTLCIIEAMKMMNEIESDVNGVVEKICVNNGTLVEYGSVLFLIRPAA